MEQLYFKNEEAKLIFILVETNGATQLRLLGINQSHYCNREKAKNWYESRKKEIANSQHPKKDEAINQLKKLYKGMGGKI